MHGVTYFTSLDLVRGYYQLPLAEESRELTAFSTPHSHWQFKRLSFGLKNAPAAFQREMQQILSGYPWHKVVVYIDDVLIMSQSFDEHLSLVGKVLATLESHGVKVKLSKCKWFVEEVEYLGHVESSSGMRKTDSYIQKVEDVRQPTSARIARIFGPRKFSTEICSKFFNASTPTQ